MTFNGATASDVIMYVTMSSNGISSSDFSVIIRPLDAGYFVLNLQGARSLGNSTYFTYTDTSNLSITIEGEVKGAASATTTVGAIRSAVGSTSTPFSLAVSAAPTVVSITPNYIWPGGGTLITITGSNFFAGTKVTIGSLPATEVTVVSSTQLTAKSPAKSKFGDTNNSDTVTPADSLCVLRAVAGLPSTTGCPTSGLNSLLDVSVIATNGMSATLTGGMTMRNADMNNSGVSVASGTLAGVSPANSLCILRLVAGLPATTGCPRPIVTASAAGASVGARTMRTTPPAVTIVVAPRDRPAGSDAVVVDLQAKVPTGGSLGSWNINFDIPSPLRLAVSEISPSFSVLQASADGRHLRVVGASLDVGPGSTTLATITLTGAESLSSNTVLGSSIAGPESLTDVGGSIVAAVLETGTVEAMGLPKRAEPVPVQAFSPAPSNRAAQAANPITKSSEPVPFTPTVGARVIAEPATVQQPQLLKPDDMIQVLVPVLAEPPITGEPEPVTSDDLLSPFTASEHAQLYRGDFVAILQGLALPGLDHELAALITDALTGLHDDEEAGVVSAIRALDANSLTALFQFVASLPESSRADALISALVAPLHTAENLYLDADWSFEVGNTTGEEPAIDSFSLEEFPHLSYDEEMIESVELDLKGSLSESIFTGFPDEPHEEVDEANGVTFLRTQD